MYVLNYNNKRYNSGVVCYIIVLENYKGIDVFLVVESVCWNKGILILILACFEVFLDKL